MSGYTQDLQAEFENTRNCLRRIARHDEQEFSKDSIVNVMEKFVKTVNAMDDNILVPCRLMDLQVGDSTDLIPAPPKTSAAHLQHHLHQTNSSGSNGRRKDRKAAVHEYLSSADLFNLYNMLNSVKNDLLWTRSDENNDEDVKSIKKNQESLSTVSETAIQPELLRLASTESATSVESSAPLSQQPKSSISVMAEKSQAANSRRTKNGENKGHIRRPSTASTVSCNSTSNLSDSESEISNENDSGMESEGNCGGVASSNSSSCGGTDTNTNSSSNIDKATELARQCRSHLNGLYRCLEQMTDAANYLTARYQSDMGPV